MADTRGDVIVVSPSWPAGTGGQRIAVASLLRACRQAFDRIHVISITEDSFEPSGEWRDGVFEWIHAKVAPWPKWLRFVRSLFRAAPAVTVRYQAGERQVLDAMVRITGDCQARRRGVAVIIEDIPTACLLPRIQSAFPHLATAIRSENLLTEAFERFAVEGPLVWRLPWMLELWKIRRFEKSVCTMADHFWTITRTEADKYVQRMGVQADGVIGACLDVDRYASVGAGDARTVVKDFFRRVWPGVRARLPDARLVLAGTGTERFTDLRSGVAGLGFVENDAAVLEQGRIFVNPQRIGAGIQIKSIVAMLAGKALVSTQVGAEGVEGKVDEHFAVADSPEEMVAAIVGLMQNPDRAHEMGRKARQLAARVYGRERFLNDSRRLLDALAAGLSRGGGQS